MKEMKKKGKKKKGGNEKKQDKRRKSMVETGAENLYLTTLFGI